MSPRRHRWLLAGYAGLAGFLVLEGTARQRGSAVASDPDGPDQGSTRAVASAYAAAGLSAPLFAQMPTPSLPDAVRPAGLGLQGAGLALRLWAMRSLEDSYTRTLKVTNAQGVVDIGPYRLIRHPGYAGSLLVWLGFALSSGSPAVVAAVASAMVPAYRYRMAAEEALLCRQLPGYEEYCERTKRLIPYVW
jgi:protein-S-isoprenylcysteine O-methyltransferase Ste14